MKFVKLKLFFTTAFILTSLLAFTQEDEKLQFDTSVLSTQPLVKLNKDGGLVKEVNMIANMRFASNNNFVNGQFINSQFRANDLRMEVIGRVTRRLKIRFRDVYSRSAGDGETADLLRRSIDLALVEYDASPKVTVSAGKMFADYGGYEIFYNPITMIVYNDLFAFGDIFLSAVKTTYKFSGKQRLSFQIANSSSRNFDQAYGTTPGAVASKAPFGLTLNWNGTFLDNHFNTKFSFSNFNLIKGEYQNFCILGAQYKKNNYGLSYDIKYSSEAVDRTGVVSTYLGNNFSNRLRDVRYVEHWLRGDYHFTPNLSTTIIGMKSASYWFGNPDKSASKNNLLRNVYTLSATLELHLSKLHNAKLFFGYVGRLERYTTYAKNNFGLKDLGTGQVLVGFMSQLVVF
ncbi:MAG: hypothetical protein RL596_361 [Bacteroidota bacterium]|jgi:hypothetical protein